MVDAYKCQNCGHVVETLGSCPSCGENEMRPTRVPESELETGDDENEDTDADENEDTDASESDSAGTETIGTTPDSQQSDETTTDEGTATNGKRRDRSERDTRTASGSGGLLAWLKSLF